MKRNYKIIIFLLLILILQIVLRVPFLHEPLERDEGIYGYLAQTMMRGDVLYKDAIDNKPPVVFFIYALIFKLLGQSALAIHIFALLTSLLTTLFIFLLGRELINEEGALVASFFYALFSGGPLIQGSSANTETFVVLFSVIAFLVFLLGNRLNKPFFYLIAGIISGLAFMTKQVALFYFLPLFIFALFEKLDLKKKFARISLLGFGFVVFPLFFVFYFLYKSAFPDFIYNAFIYNMEYVRSAINPNLYKSWSNISLNENSPIWIMSIISILFILIKERAGKNLLLAGWGLFSFFGVCSGGFYFGHYYIQVIPALVLLSAYFVIKWREQVRSLLPNLLFVVVILFLTIFILNYQFPFYFIYTPDQISIAKYTWVNNFPNSVKVGNWIRNNSSADDAVYMWGAQPEINFYAQRRSVSRYFCAHPFYFNKKFPVEKGKAEVYAAIVKKRPKFIVWTWPPESFPKLYEFTKKNYKPVKSFQRWMVFKIKP